MYKGKCCGALQKRYDIVPTTSAEKHFSRFCFRFKSTLDENRANKMSCPDAHLTCSILPSCQSDSGISRSERVETMSTGYLQHAAESKFNECTSLSGSRLPCPEGLHPNDGMMDSTFSCPDQRPPSPKSIASFDAFTSLSPDSLIPTFDCKPCNYMHLSENRFVSPDSVMLKGDCTNSSFDTLFYETRPESSISIAFDREFPESFITIPSDDEYTQSSLDYCLSELRPSTPQLPDSGNLVEVLNQLPHGHSLPDETVQADNTLIYKPVSGRLMAHILDPLYEGTCACDEVSFFEDVGRKQSEKACNLKK